MQTNDSLSEQERNTWRIGQEVAAFYHIGQKVPSRILTITRIGKASFWTDNDERWVVRDGSKHGRDTWSCARVERFDSTDESRWKSIRERENMQRELKRYAEMAERLPLDHLTAIYAVIQSMAQGIRMNAAAGETKDF